VTNAPCARRTLRRWDGTTLELDGFFETVALETVRADGRVMLAYAWDGVPLLPEHGFPLSIYISDRYGMKQPKWIRSIEAMDHGY
jgi:DMSO/TMAO reductase YedYZ molybdopterin-dependent catalytic subunit